MSACACRAGCRRSASRAARASARWRRRRANHARGQWVWLRRSSWHGCGDARVGAGRWTMIATSPAYPQPMAPAIRARRLAYRVAAQLLRFLRPLVPIDWGGVKCVLTDGDRVLLVRHTYGSRQWDLPGGGRHRGERSIDAARREMHEELG